jgi:hypothetical protein
MRIAHGETKDGLWELNLLQCMIREDLVDYFNSYKGVHSKRPNNVTDAFTWPTYFVKSHYRLYGWSGNRIFWMISSLEYVSTEVESRFPVKGVTPMSPRTSHIWDRIDQYIDFRQEHCSSSQWYSSDLLLWVDIQSLGLHKGNDRHTKFWY